jgi:hypothetical protein
MEIQFITDSQGRKKAKDILEHVYLAGLIEDRKGSESKMDLDDLLNAEGFTRADLLK